MGVSLRDGIDWVGAVDWEVRDFHGYDTARGSTYNAYLVRDEKTALIDTVKAPFAGELLGNLAGVADPASVDYVVCNHAEPDHAGALPEVLAALPNAALVCTEKCRQTLAMYFDVSGWRVRILAPGESLSLGARTLEFVQTPLAHWPESMFTYLPQDGVLFSMDAFGQHYASAERFDDETDLSAVMDEARTYYANILLPFGTPTAKAMSATAKLDIRLIAPSHGVIWRGHIPAILEAYERWTTGKVRPKVVVLYDSMWESTAEMAAAVRDGASGAGAETVLMHARRGGNITQMASEVLEAAAVAVGSPTLNGTMMPAVGGALTYLQGLKPGGKAAVAFGSSGWARGGPESVNAALESLKWDLVREPVRAQYRPAPEALEACRDAGRMLAERALAMAGGM